MGRTVGIDYGTRRVGLAVADPLELFAQGHGTFSPDDAVSELDSIAATDGLDVVVIGWPLDPDTGEGPMTDRVQQYISRIANRFPDAVIVKWDETNTSREAAERLLGSGAKRKKRREKGILDRIAATIILQEYLDAQKA
ncbi:MAG: Holliday junction resolvase RuvX [Bacteroidetes bacterium]|nr:Holliday junction resolvase RuvX [Bacteroidota bacterium]